MQDHDLDGLATIAQIGIAGIILVIGLMVIGAAYAAFEFMKWLLSLA